MKPKVLILCVLSISSGFVSNAQTTCNTTVIFDNAFDTPPNDNQYCTEVVNNQVRYFFANAIPNHTTGTFPNAGNPNAYTPQDLTRTVCYNPQIDAQVSIYDAENYGCFGLEFGIAINGVLFDPLAAEWFTGTTGIVNQDWNLNALSSSVNLGLDANEAHVQPNGSYHYHGDPAGLASTLGIVSTIHSPIIGYAADGFPIYYKYVYDNPLDANSGVVEKLSGYQLKSGSRGGDGINAPSGSYDGTYTQDYEYVGAGNFPLDAANGRFGYTPEYPNGTYYYVITSNYPKIPRHFNATVDRSFTVGAPGGNCGTTNTTTYCTPLSVWNLGKAEASFAIEPNPVQTWFALRLADEWKSQVAFTQVSDPAGKLLVRLEGFSDQMDASFWASGTYYVTLVMRNGEMLGRKMLKE